MKIFIAGICGTFMAGIAQLAQSLGHQVSGCDANVYPPMSDVLARAGIDVKEGYAPGHIAEDIDCVVIGNALSRGNPLVEYVLERGIRYQSGPEWLKDAVLRDRKVIAIAGTHGKTTTASMIAWILQSAGLAPGYLIGGQPGNFEATAQIGSGDYFVIEADEYDTAFFDKRSKFVHYLPHIAVLNNLEFDHADIFDDLPQIQRQFHHLVRIVPQNGRIIVNADAASIKEVLAQGSWSPIVKFSIEDERADWYAEATADAEARFRITEINGGSAKVVWQCIGKHNMQNALAACAAAAEAGVPLSNSAAALAQFKPSARRLERMAESENTVLFQDFAHHPTAIKTTLEALRASYPDRTILAIIEPRSNTMQMGHHGNLLGKALTASDETFFYTPTALDWDPSAQGSCRPVYSYSNATKLIHDILARCHKTNAISSGRRYVIIAMSNGSFDGIPQQIADRITTIQA